MSFKLGLWQYSIFNSLLLLCNELHKHDGTCSVHSFSCRIAIPEIEQQLALADKEVGQMGICSVGAGGPCNVDSNWDRTH